MIPTWLIWSAVLCAVAIIAFTFGVLIGGSFSVGDYQRRQQSDDQEDDF